MKKRINSEPIRLYDSGENTLDRFSLVLLYPYRKMIKDTGIRGIGIGLSEGTDQVIVCDSFEIPDRVQIGSDEMNLGAKMKLNCADPRVPVNIRKYVDRVGKAWLEACEKDSPEGWSEFNHGTCRSEKLVIKEI